MGKRRKKLPPSDSGPVGDGEADSTSPEEAHEPEESAKEDMAHVGRDVLAGSPDIFADAAPEPAQELQPDMPQETEPESRAEAAAAPTEAAAAAGQSPDQVEPAPAQHEVVQDEVVQDEVVQDEVVQDEAAPDEAVPVAAEAVAVEAAPPPSSPAPPTASFPAHPVQPAAPSRSSRSSVAFGVVLVVVGLFALAIVVLGIDVTQYGWPLFLIVPGLTLLIVGFFGAGAGASIPGGMLTMLGLVFAYQSAFNDWASWAFIWTLVVPGGVGLGMYLQALRDHDVAGLRRGRNLIIIAVVMFLIGFVFFESILGISGDIYGWFGKGALPILLIIGGVVLLVRNAQRSRPA